MTEPFDPHKIPIITVHGLLSSPITWINLQNDLMDDPVAAHSTIKSGTSFIQRGCRS